MENIQKLKDWVNSSSNHELHEQVLFKVVNEIERLELALKAIEGMCPEAGDTFEQAVTIAREALNAP